MPSHFPVMLPSKSKKPVRLPPGLARLSTKPEPTGSETDMNTMGMLLVPCFRSRTYGVDSPRITSGRSATSSLAIA